MGRDVAGLHIDKKPNVKLNGNLNPTARVAQKAIPHNDEIKDSKMDDCAVKDGNPDDCYDKQDVLTMKKPNYEPEEKIIRLETKNSTDQKFSSPVRPASQSAVNGTTDVNSPSTSNLQDETNSSCEDHINSVETHDSGVKCGPKSNDQQSPRTAKKPQPNSPSMSGKQMHPNDKKFFDEEDNWSLASSTATSRTVKTRVTVPVAPRFSVVDRLERRKEFYSKLEEKHKALEKERLEYEARIKEEEQAAIKQLRKSMTYKANPVPSFYHEGPPLKVELKKLPVTRAKSPNLTRRKSCSDAVKSSAENKEPYAEATRHSVGVYREGKSSPLTSKSNDRIAARKLSGATKVKEHPQQLKETSKNPCIKKQTRVDVAIGS